MSTVQPKQRLLIDDGSVPRLADQIKLHHDKIREQWVLLAPERVLELSGPAVDILKQCDGVNSVAKIVTLMCSEYNAPKDEIQSDLLDMLQSLLDKRFIQI